MYKGKSLKELAEMHPFLFAMWQHQEPKTMRGLSKHSSNSEFMLAMADAMEEYLEENENSFKITCVRSLKEAIGDVEEIA